MNEALAATTKTMPADVASPVAIIAGSGVLPFAAADSLVRRGIEPVIYAIEGYCDLTLAKRFRHHRIALGKFGALVSSLKSEGCRDVLFLGGLVRPSLTDLRLDWGGLRMVPAFLAGLRGGDDHLLKTAAGFFEQRGFRLLGLKDVAPDLLMPQGILTRAKPGDAEMADIAKGRELLRALSPFDVAQGVVVVDGHVISVEDLGGTDALLARVAGLRTDGRLRAKAGRGVLVKMPKDGQDLRFDLPALGPKTVQGVADAGLAGIAVPAGNCVVAEADVMTSAADEKGVFIIGMNA